MRTVAKVFRAPVAENALGGDALCREVLFDVLAVHDVRSETRDGCTQPSMTFPAHRKGASASRSLGSAPPTTMQRRCVP